MNKETENLYRNNRKIYLSTDEIYNKIYRLERVLIRRDDRVGILFSIMREMIRKDGRNFDTIVYKLLDMLHLELEGEAEALKEEVGALKEKIREMKSNGNCKEQDFDEKNIPF